MSYDATKFFICNVKQDEKKYLRILFHKNVQHILQKTHENIINR